MSLIKTRLKDEIMEMAMVEIAFEILKEEKDTISFYELVQRIKDLKGISDAAVQRRLSHFYTDMNIDGRFVSLGDNKWGLKAWYPIESSEEELGNTNKPTKRKKVVAEDEDFDEYDEDFEDEDFDALEVDDEFAKASSSDDDDEDEDEDEDLDEDFGDIADSDEELDEDIEDEEDQAAEEELYEVEEEDEEDR
ncbi:DNA-directed RNA polymerase subunit delta [Fictibacillus enclensis]|uniref:DNA-directed RNA polymerase subunit delta n=1 Tax=Fictibacillus enclensis TaxID=1017270 RepID=UPI0025A27C32|nr:DNA-directed RNA polymerase subunit delta [Fictibacillus enclensis]MDM5340833.1 DNA-directed RNA polymerase subunit delta [Fictibacillus enclensis]